MSRRHRRALRDIVADKLLALIERHAGADAAAAARLADGWAGSGLVVFWAGTTVAVARSDAALRRSRWWADTPLEMITAAVASPFPQPGFELERLEELGVRVVDLRLEELVELLDRAPPGRWIILAKSPISARRTAKGGPAGAPGWSIGVYGEEPGDLDWISS